MTSVDRTGITIPHDSEKRRRWIIWQLSLKNLSLSELARTHKSDRQAASRALRSSSLQWEQWIAEALDLTPQQLFPERYDDDGIPLHVRGRPHNMAGTQ